MLSKDTDHIDVVIIGGGVVGAGVAYRTRSDVRPVYCGELAEANAMGGIKAGSGLVESDNPLYYFPSSAESMTGVKRLVYAKVKGHEYHSEHQGVLECEMWVGTYAAMYAMLDALSDAEALMKRVLTSTRPYWPNNSRRCSS